MRFSKEIETQLKKEVISSFGKDNWNTFHTFTAVHWMKELIKKEGGDELVLITTMYLHDIGYVNLIKDGSLLKERKDAKAVHMELGAQKAEVILTKLKYPKDAIDKIFHLIRTHDNLTELSTRYELFVMEADSLAGIDVDRVKPNFSKEDHIKYLDNFEKERLPRFVTKTGKDNVVKLLRKARSLDSTK